MHTLAGAGSGIAGCDRNTSDCYTHALAGAIALTLAGANAGAFANTGAGIHRASKSVDRLAN